MGGTLLEIASGQLKSIKVGLEQKIDVIAGRKFSNLADRVSRPPK
jgi:hypothetical protein